MKLSVHCNAHHYLSSSFIHFRCQGSSNFWYSMKGAEPLHKQNEEFEECEDKNFIVSIAIDKLPQVPSLIISLPLDCYQHAQVDIVSRLRQRVISTHSLPSGWVDVTGSDYELVLCYIDSGATMPKLSMCESF